MPPSLLKKIADFYQDLGQAQTQAQARTDKEKKQKTALRDFANALIPDLEHISIVAPVTRDEEICVVYTFRGIRHYWDESGDTALDENDVEGLPFSLQTHQKVLTFIRQQKECEESKKE